MTWRTAGAWIVGVACGIGVVALSGAEYHDASPPQGMGLDQYTAIAQQRGWEAIWLPEGCGQGRPCVTLMYRRPRIFFFMKGL